MENNATPTPPSRDRKPLADFLLKLKIVGLLLLVPLAAIADAACAVARAAYGRYRGFMHVHVESVGLFGGLAVTAAVTYGLYLINPNTPSLHEATLQVLCFAPVLLFLCLHATIYTYKHLLPVPFKAFMDEIGSKINAVSLPPLEELLPSRRRFDGNTDADVYAPSELLARAQLKLKYYTLQFIFRCVRFVLFSLPFFAIFLAMKGFVLFSLTMQPHS